MRKVLCCSCCLIFVSFLAFGASACASHSKDTTYRLTLEYAPANNKIFGKEEVSFYNCMQNVTDVLKFQLYANAYRRDAMCKPFSELYESVVYYDGESYGDIQILNVTGCKDYEIGGVDKNLLCVTLNEPLYPDERISLNIEFEVTLANVNHRLGVGQRTVNLSYFYPVLCPYNENGFRELVYVAHGDPFVSDCADYSVEITVPAEYRIVSGMTGKISTQNGRSTFRGSANCVRDVSFVLGKDVEEVSTEIDGIRLEYWYVEDDDPSAVLNTMTESLSYFSKQFGKYVYPRYVIVQTDLPQGGMECSSMAFLSARLPKREKESVVVHETAHQWWYAMVGSDQYCCAWQDEGLAEYSVALFWETHFEYGMTYKQAIANSENSYRAYYSVRSQMTGNVDTSMNRSLDAFSGEYEYRNLAYDKGVILFDRVRSVLGDERFFSSLKTYFETYKGKSAMWEQLVQCFSTTGLNAEGIFLSFLDGTCVI